MVAGSFGGTVCMEASVHCVLMYFEIPHSFIIWQEWHGQGNPMKWIGGSEGWGHKAVDTEVLSLDRFVVCSSCMGVRDQTCLPSNAWGMEENHPWCWHSQCSGTRTSEVTWWLLCSDLWQVTFKLMSRRLSFYLNILSHYSGCFIVFYFRSFCFREVTHDEYDQIHFEIKVYSFPVLLSFPKDSHFIFKWQGLGKYFIS